MKLALLVDKYACSCQRKERERHLENSKLKAPHLKEGVKFVAKHIHRKFAFVRTQLDLVNAEGIVNL